MVLQDAEDKISEDPNCTNTCKVTKKDLLTGSSKYMFPGFIHFVSHFNVYEIGFVLDSKCAFNRVVCFIPRKVEIKPLENLSIKVPQKAM